MVLPEIAAMKGVRAAAAISSGRRRVDSHAADAGGIAAGFTATLAWGVLLHDVGKPATFRSAKETGDRIRFDGHVEVGMAIARRDLRQAAIFE